MWFKWKKQKDNHVQSSGDATLEFVESKPACLSCAGRSDIGRQRQVNQDQFLIADLYKGMQVQSASEPFRDEQLCGETMGKLLFVADGVGGASAGEVASKMAIQTMAQYLLNSMHWLFHPTQAEVEQFVDDLKAGARLSHEVVLSDAENEPGHRGMGTTLTVAYLVWPMLYVLHIGDSRCYVLRGDKLKLLTKDQTLAQQLHDFGHLDDQEFEQSPFHHVLLSAIGSQGGAEAVVYKTRLVTGDRIMLCSDGVNAHLEDADIQEILGLDRGAEEICEMIVDAANQRGGKDNITAVIAISSQE